MATTAAVSFNAAAMNTKLAMVPRPGRSRNGIQNSNTTIEISAVLQPTETCKWRDSPCAKTVHGVAPNFETTRSPSPTPKRHSPPTSGATMRGRNAHVDDARHEVTGIL